MDVSLFEMAEQSKRKRKSAPNWHDFDVGVLLDAVQEVLPLGGNGWEKVQQIFSRNQAITTARDADACKRKFIALKNHRKPTGDPDCPPNVVRAKRLQREIDSHASVQKIGSDGEVAEAESGAFFNMDEEHSSGSSRTSCEEDNEDGDIGAGGDAVNVEESLSNQPLAKYPSVCAKPKANKPNHTGVTHDELWLMGKHVTSTSNRTPTSGGSSMSYTAKRRQSIDKLIYRSERDANSDKDMMQLTVIMEERSQKCQDERDERECRRLEERRLEREEREALDR